MKTMQYYKHRATRRQQDAFQEKTKIEGGNRAFAIW